MKYFSLHAHALTSVIKSLKDNHERRYNIMLLKLIY